MTLAEFDAEAERDALAEAVHVLRDDYARRFRSARVVPLCERYGLRFAQGMGSYTFETSAGCVVDSIAAPPGSILAAELEAIECQLDETLAGGPGDFLAAYVDDYDGRRPCLGLAREAVESTAEPIERATIAAQHAARFADRESRAAHGHALRSAEAAERAAAEGVTAAGSFEAAHVAVCALRMATAQRIIADGYRAHALAAIGAARNAAAACRLAARDACDHAHTAELLGETGAEAEARKRAAIVRATMARERRLKG